MLHQNTQQTRLNNNQNIQQSNTVGTGESRVGTGGVQCRIETGKGCFNVEWRIGLVYVVVFGFCWGRMKAWAESRGHPPPNK